MGTATAKRPRKPRRATGGFIARPIRNEKEYDAAVEAMNDLALEPGGSLSRDDRDRLDLLVMVVSDYDGKHFRMEAARRTPVQRLKYLMQEMGLKVIDLAEIFGGRPRISDVLAGKREMSKSQILAVSKRLKVSPALFLA